MPGITTITYAMLCLFSENIPFNSAQDPKVLFDSYGKKLNKSVKVKFVFKFS